VRRHLAEAGSAASARASARVKHGYEISYELPDERPLVSVVIVNCDHIDALDRCLRSLREHAGSDSYEVVIVEQGSVDSATFEYYRRAEEDDPRVRTIFSQGYGKPQRARLVNYGVSRTQGTYLLMLSPDVEATEDGWMGRLVSLCLREGTGAAAPRLVRIDGTIASTGLALCNGGPVPIDRYRIAADCAGEDGALLHGVTMASGDCLMVDAASFARLGGMSEDLSGGLCDEDLCLRLWGAGERVVLDPQSVLTLHRSLAADDQTTPSSEDLAAVGRLWGDWPFGFSATDPTMGPNVDPTSPYHILVH
jgi:GT2 family glycosyltransferase